MQIKNCTFKNSGLSPRIDIFTEIEFTENNNYYHGNIIIENSTTPARTGSINSDSAAKDLSLKAAGTAAIQAARRQAQEPWRQRSRTLRPWRRYLRRRRCRIRPH